MGHKRKNFEFNRSLILTHVFEGFLIHILKNVLKLIYYFRFYGNFRICVISHSNMIVPGHIYVPILTQKGQANIK